MFRTIRIAALSALVGLGAISVPSAAQADGIYFSFGNSGARAGVHIGEGGAYGHRSYRRHHRPRHFAHACSPGRAVYKAKRMGIRHAHVTRVNHRVIRVSGRKHHRYVRVTFARAPHCPVVRYR